MNCYCLPLYKRVAKLCGIRVLPSCKVRKWRYQLHIAAQPTVSNLDISLPIRKMNRQSYCVNLCELPTTLFLCECHLIGRGSLSEKFNAEITRHFSTCPKSILPFLVPLPSLSLLSLHFCPFSVLYLSGY